MSVDNRKLTGLEIAITGMAIRVPGADSPAAFWDNLVNGRETLCFFTDAELEASGIRSAQYSQPGYVKARGIIDDAEMFDAAFFGFTPKEAERLDPQIRLLCELAYEAMENGGCNPATWQGLMGVYLGAAPATAWQQHTLAACRASFSDEFATLLLNDKDFLSTRLSYLLNLHGPSMTIYTACSTSLVTVDTACQALLTGKCDAALAGAISLSLPVKAGHLHEPGMILSADGHTRSFDEKASGSVFSDGAGIVMLKRLADALADGDTIHAVIKGSAINNDGARKIGYTAPGSAGQAEVIAMAHQVAEIAPQSISYIETHGSATAIGDKIEIEALESVFRNVPGDFRCPLGSVKSNFGHLNTAAGMAGLIKTALALKHGMIPPSLHCTRPIAGLNTGQSRFYVNTTLAPWTNDQQPLRAGVSSFGIGGTNAHLILEEAPVAATDTPSWRDHYLLLLSAKTPAALEARATQLAAYLSSATDINMADVAYTLQTGRQEFRYRSICVAADREEAIRKLTAQSNRGTQTAGVNQQCPPLVFLFAGLGGQYPDMGRDLYEKEPFFRKEVDRCQQLLAGTEMAKWTQYHNNHTPDNSFTGSQLRMFVFEYALARLLMHWGLQPDHLAGYSLGEYVAACLAGVFSLEDALQLMLIRGRLVETLPAGAMVSIPLPAAEAMRLLPEDVYMAIDNGPSCVVSGGLEDIIHLEKQLKEERLLSFRISSTHAVHAPAVSPVLSALKAHLASMVLHPPVIPFLSNVTGQWMTAADATSPEYWCQHLSQTVRFADNLQHITAIPDATLVEIGPGNDLTMLVKRLLPPEQENRVLSTVRTQSVGVSDVAYLLNRVGQLWLRGHQLSWENFYREENRCKIPLPAYPFEKVPHTIDIAQAVRRDQAETANTNSITKQEDLSSWFYLPSWKRQPLLPYQPAVDLPVSLLLFVPPGMPAPLLLNELQTWGITDVVMVHLGNTFEQTNATDFIIHPQSAEDYREMCRRLQAAGWEASHVLHAWNIGNSEEQVLTTASIKEKQYTGFYSLLYLMQALEYTQSLSLSLQLTVAADRIFRITGDENTDAGKTTLLGLVKVIPQEYPGVRCRVVEPGGDDFFRQVIREVLLSTTGIIAAYRGKSRWVQQMEPLSLPPVPAKTARLRVGGTYLVTGGMGNIGLAIATYLHREYQAKIILAGRTPLPPRSQWEQQASAEVNAGKRRKISTLLALEQEGATIAFMAADAGSLEEMQQVVTEAESKFGPIHGVFHTAGIIDIHAFPTIGQLQPSDYERHCHPKITGTLVLEEIFRNRQPDFILLASSLSPILGGLGLASYAAANQFMDAMALRLAAAGKPWISLNWADWEGWEAGLENMMISSEAIALNISAAEGIETLKRVLHHALEEGQVAISSGNLLQRMQKWVYTANDHSGTVATVDASMAIPLKPKPALLNEYLPPADALEEKLVEQWSEQLGFSGIGVQDDFMELGGDSLKAIIMLSRVHRLTKTVVSLEEFFRNRTIQHIAQVVRHTKHKAYKPVMPAPDRMHYPLSAAQRRLFFLREFDTSGIGYNETHVDILEGRLDIDRLTNAFRTIIQRHEIYRTALLMTPEGPVQQVMEQVPFEPELLEADEAALPALIRNFARPFHFDQPPFMRVGIVKLAADKHAVIFDRHHIISDGISSEILDRELVALCGGASLPAVTLQYKDYAVWQEEEQHSEYRRQQLDWWKEIFQQDIPVLQLPTDYSRPPVQLFDGDAVHFTLDEATVLAARKLVKELDVTMHSLLLAVFNVLLSGLSGQRDIVVGTPVGGRRHPDLENISGIFVNTLPLHNQLPEEMPFNTFLQEVKKRVFTALENQDCQYEDLVEQLHLPKDISRNPLFDAMLVYQHFSIRKKGWEGIRRTPYHHVTDKAKFDLNLVCWDQDASLYFELEYSTHLFKKATVERFARYFIHILQEVLLQPALPLSSISLLPDSEKEQLLYTFNHLKSDRCKGLVLQELFIEQVERTPEAIALVDGAQTFTYRELNRKANQLAETLMKKGVTTDVLVALYTGRSAATVVGMLGIIKAGGAWLPIDPVLPVNRVQYMLTDSKVKFLLADDETVSQAATLSDTITVMDISREDTYSGNGDEPTLINKPGDLVYVIYTSGSTGRPKGIMLEHRNAVNLVQHCIYHTGMDFNKVLQFSTISFDVSFSEIFYTLCAGGTVYMVREAVRKNIPDLLAFIGEHHISTVFFPMSLLRLLFRETAYIEAIPACIRHIQTAGEQVIVSNEFRHYLQCNGVYLHNHYGPSETHVITTLTISPEGDIPALPGIGTPILNTDIYILDAMGNITPMGVPGELCAGGEQVGRGYIGNETLTREKFIPHPFQPNQLIYRTGDIARWLPDGTIDFLGRIDGQVKIRGYRVEPGETESCLLEIPAVKEAVVTVQQHTDGDKYLCAHLVLNEKIAVEMLRQLLSRRLPDYMIPSAFVMVDKIPVTANGKIDKAALLPPAQQQQEGYVAPVTAAEILMTQIWAAALQMDAAHIGVIDNFFILGGHSLKAMQLIAGIQQAFNVKIPLPEFFRDPTVRANIAAVLQGVRESSTIINHTASQTFYPASDAQQRLYFLHRLHPGGLEYNMPAAYLVKGHLDLVALQAALQQLMARHPVLSITYDIADNNIVQVPATNRTIEIIRLPATTRNHPEAAFHQFIRPFDLNRGPLFRITVADIDDNNAWLFLDFHHSIADGISSGIFIRELNGLLAGEALAPVSLQYQHYAAWQQSEEYRQLLSRQEVYWLEVFRDLPLARPSLPTDFNRAIGIHTAGDTVITRITAAQYQALKQLAATENTTVFVVLMTLYHVLLSHLTGSEEMIVGTPVTGRRRTELQTVVGLFVNTLALRSFPNDYKTFGGFLGEVSQLVLEAFDQQEYPLDLLIRRLGLSNLPGRNPLFDVMMEFDYADDTTLQIPGAEVTPFPLKKRIAKFDLVLYCREVGNTLELELCYATHLFKQERMMAFMNALQVLIAQVPEHPHLPLATLKAACQPVAAAAVQPANIAR
ncbi:hybrid non-ribosomal peptide synthetase/type I polyketide synthase [Chitinophaga eiseniae]|uniref:Amino acid adenylation domain-containing protein n=1 Tax=Chitinophaga eiseniae TaxID=634771 RepID=A0A847SKT4_9BACT|nr:hybrid non-ribosomal peptide synthetase/type I polyketide synthase [Chitinophaga eiseniae]NLR77749.1 amino acid adenylation domain-containing protein [Chitinophaga eiseniae]